MFFILVAMQSLDLSCFFRYRGQPLRRCLLWQLPEVFFQSCPHFASCCRWGGNTSGLGGWGRSSAVCWSSPGSLFPPPAPGPGQPAPCQLPGGSQSLWHLPHTRYTRMIVKSFPVCHLPKLVFRFSHTYHVVRSTLHCITVSHAFTQASKLSASSWGKTRALKDFWDWIRSRVWRGRLPHHPPVTAVAGGHWVQLSLSTAACWRRCCTSKGESHYCRSTKHYGIVNFINYKQLNPKSSCW